MTGSRHGADDTASHGGSPVPIYLHAARNRFADMIPSRLMAIKNLRVALSVSADGRRELVEIGALCHKIAGVAETLGFARAGDLAGRLDSAIDHELASGIVPGDIWHRINHLLETLVDELEHASGP